MNESINVEFDPIPDNVLVFFDMVQECAIVVTEDCDRIEADQIIIEEGFVAGLWALGDPKTRQMKFHKWVSDVSRQKYTDMVKEVEQPKKTKGSKVMKKPSAPMMKRPSSHDTNVATLTAEQQKCVNAIIQEYAKYENSESGQKQARYRNAVRSRVFHKLEKRLPIEGIPDAHISMVTAKVVSKVKNVE